jgi:hypothetical protein
MPQILFGLLIGFGATAGLAADAPISLHPENGHYFLWGNRPTILVTSGEHYGSVLNLDFDYRRYLEELKRHGLNHTRTFSGTYREIPGSFGISDNSLAPHPNRFACPWLRSDKPGYFDGGNKFDLTKWDPAYFARLKDFLSCAKQAGVVVEMNLFCPMYDDDLWKACPMNAANNVNGIGNCPREEVYALKHQDLTDVQLAVTRKIVEELREFDNLYFEVCNEPYFGGVEISWQHRIADAIVEAERTQPARHLISMNIANGRAKVEKPHASVSIFNFHYCDPPDTVDMNYGLNKAIGENETGFRGSDDAIYRTEGWMFMLAGGSLYNNLDYSFTPAHPDGTLEGYSSPGGGSAALRSQLRVLKSFVESFDFIHMTPARDIVRKVEPGLRSRAMVKQGEAYAIYVHVPLPGKPDNIKQLESARQHARLTLELPAGDYSLEWIRPTDGQIAGKDICRHTGGELTLETPEFAVDLALRVLREKE